MCVRFTETHVFIQGLEKRENAGVSRLFSALAVDNLAARYPSRGWLPVSTPREPRPGISASTPA